MVHPDSTRLLEAHVQALFTMAANDRLLRINESNGGPAPRFFLGQTPEGNRWWAGAELPDHAFEIIDREVAALDAQMNVGGPGPSLLAVETVIEELAPIAGRWSGPAFRFPDRLPRSSAVLMTTDNAHLLQPLMSAWYGDVVSCAPLMAVIAEGQVVAVCGSVRRTPVAHEAGVETASSFRGRGFATQASIAWARAVAAQGHLPLYSTSWTNPASCALARRLGLIQYASDYHLT